MTDAQRSGAGLRPRKTPLRLTKSERERRIFEALAPLTGWNVSPGSIVQPDPPDIICNVAGEGRLAIELVALDAPQTRSRLDNMITTDEAWDRAAATLSVENQERLRIEANDIFFSITFRNEAGLRDRTRALQAVQEFLLQHPGYVGVLAPKRIGLSRGVDTATVHRGHVTNGPKFSHFSAGTWLPPQASKLEGKLQPGRYRSEFPMELFAYAIHDEPDLAVGSLESLQDLIVKLLPASSFRRAHVFDLGFRRHLYAHPE
jgi:hypothetical protein